VQHGERDPDLFGTHPVRQGHVWDPVPGPHEVAHPVAVAGDREDVPLQLEQLDRRDERAHQDVAVPPEAGDRPQPHPQGQPGQHVGEAQLAVGGDGCLRGEGDVRTVRRAGVQRLAGQPGVGEGPPLREHLRLECLVEQQLHRLHHGTMVPDTVAVNES